MFYLLLFFLLRLLKYFSTCLHYKHYPLKLTIQTCTIFHLFEPEAHHVSFLPLPPPFFMLAEPAKPPCVLENSIFCFLFCTFVDHILLSTYQAYFVSKPDTTKKAWQGGLMIYPPYLVPEIVSYTYLPVCWQPHPLLPNHRGHKEYREKISFISMHFVAISYLKISLLK
ncbi:hypothetical protein KSU1_D0907 [Candidatus Jettenia caeni]|uniref:Uncharacterized protein n=1 Tax=Candidatus Jettenia caeni TaxID=247490 RepID=I3IR71_9BACT|nr:hypothetical protein KSU1_D0907 [Candidatus Jettenia caeni]